MPKINSYPLVNHPYPHPLRFGNQDNKPPKDKPPASAPPKEKEASSNFWLWVVGGFAAVGATGVAIFHYLEGNEPKPAAKPLPVPQPTGAAPEASTKYLHFSKQDSYTPEYWTALKAISTQGGLPNNYFDALNDGQKASLWNDLYDQLNDYRIQQLAPKQVENTYEIPSRSPKGNTIIQFDFDKHRLQNQPNVFQLRVRALAQQLLCQMNAAQAKPAEVRAQHQDWWQKLFTELFRDESDQSPADTLTRTLNQFNLDPTASSFDFAAFLDRQVPEGRGLKEYKGQKALKQKVVDELIAPLLFEQISLAAKPELKLGWFFDGIPGTGRTELAKRIAETLGLKPVELSLSMIGSGFEAQSENNLLEKFELANGLAKKNGVAVLILDELEQLGMNRSLKQGTLVSSLLENITKYIGDNDNIRLLIIGTGNFPELIDPALKAPHRLGNPLTVSQPDAVGRADVIETDMKRLKITLASDFSLDAAQKEAGRKQFIERAVTGSEGMTIAEIKKIFTNLTAIHSDFYTVEHLSSAISRTKSEIEKNKETLQKI